MFDDLKLRILELMEDSNYIPLEVNKICEKLDLTDAISFTKVMKTLNELEREFIIGHTSKGKFDLLKRLRRFVGKIDLKEAGFGFVITDELEEDIFIPKGLTLNAMNRDTVLVEVTTSLDDPEGRIVEIISRNTKYLVGTLKQKGKQYIVYPDNFKMGIIAFIKRKFK